MLGDRKSATRASAAAATPARIQSVKVKVDAFDFTALIQAFELKAFGKKQAKGLVKVGFSTFQTRKTGL
jgi:hypothetical protein